jgi:hypothetical protein
MTRMTSSSNTAAFSRSIAWSCSDGSKESILRNVLVPATPLRQAFHRKSASAYTLHRHLLQSRRGTRGALGAHSSLREMRRKAQRAPPTAASVGSARSRHHQQTRSRSPRGSSSVRELDDCLRRAKHRPLLLRRQQGQQQLAPQLQLRASPTAQR